ncbi:hypothetical protein HanIR_Chr16g0813931 [Helianthus annuus]|nr:hypothetical protein HanIR_Chr16g0813931 [Helianthus annuus]
MEMMKIKDVGIWRRWCRYVTKRRRKMVQSPVMESVGDVMMTRDVTGVDDGDGCGGRRKVVRWPEMSQ